MFRRVFIGMTAVAWVAIGVAEVQAQPQPFVCPIPLPGNAPCRQPEFQNCGIDVGGTVRQFCIHKPTGPLDGLPVVWGFHGRTGDGGIMANHLADQTEQGMVLVAPSALESGDDCVPAWRHLGRGRANWAELDTGADSCSTPAAPSHTADNDADLHFVEALLDEIDAQVEGASHYALGFSNGGGMVYQLMITRPLSARFEAFAALATAANREKIDHPAPGGSGPWSAETKVRHPVLGLQGTADRVFVPVARMMDHTSALVAAAQAAAGAVAAGTATAAQQTLADSSCNMGGNITVEGVFQCWREFPMARGLPGNTYIDDGVRTRRWLIRRNQPQPRAIEGVYPDLGHGRDTGPRREDTTVTVRREWPARRGDENSQPVVWLNVIDAAHTLPGSRGAYPPCPNNNCDIDVIREVLQFWRANAGLRSLWR